MSALFRARRPAPAEPTDAYVYSGRQLLGFLKPLASGGWEAFTASGDDELVYVGKGETRREAAAMLHAARARLRGAPPLHNAPLIDTSARF